MGNPVSQITQAAVVEPRGLINSTCEAKIRTEKSQQKLKIAEAEERIEDTLDIDAAVPMNNIVNLKLEGRATKANPITNMELSAV
jgi:hypothetical protein